MKVEVVWLITALLLLAIIIVASYQTGYRDGINYMGDEYARLGVERLCEILMG